MLRWFKKKKSDSAGQQVSGSTSEKYNKTRQDIPAGQTCPASEVNAQVEVFVALPPGTQEFTQPPPLPAGVISRAATVPAESAEAEIKESPFQRLKQGLAKTRGVFADRVDALFLGKKTIDAALLDELEEIMITADLGVSTTMELVDSVRDVLSREELADPRALKKNLKSKLEDYLLGSATDKLAMPAAGPLVIMVVGVNGVGKTTTIGKMAYKFIQEGKKVLLVAADTFRAAAAEQLGVWSKRIGADIIAPKAGADPSSVVYDALEPSRSGMYDVIVVDTAGRLHTKVNLMEELKKIKRVMAKKHPGAPHEMMVVLDATTGQNAISQVKLFHEAVEVTGLTLTKLDGTAKGGIVVNVCREFQIPIRFIGIGEKMEDLRDFDPKDFVEALFASDDA